MHTKFRSQARARRRLKQAQSAVCKASSYLKQRSRAVDDVTQAGYRLFECPRGTIPAFPILKAAA